MEGAWETGGWTTAAAEAAAAAPDPSKTHTSPNKTAPQAELSAAEALGTSTVEVPLPDGGVLQATLGQDHTINPADGREYAIKWAQDDAGRLVVLDVLPLGPGGALGRHGGGHGHGGGQLGVVIGRGSSAGGALRRRNRSGAEIMRAGSLSAMLSSGIDLLLGKSAPALLDSASSGGGDSSGGGAARGGGGGGPAAEHGEGDFRISSGAGAPRHHQQ